MRSLPAIDDRMFPPNRRWLIVRFWIAYWLWFFLFLPWMLVRQAGLSARQALGAIWTWNRTFELFDGRLRLVFMNSVRSLAVTTLFGERFTAIHHRDVLIDPGPVFGRRRLQRYLASHGEDVHLIVATHAHEEHVGNTALAATLTGAALQATPVTLRAVRDPGRLSLMRRAFIGQPESAASVALQPLGEVIETPAARLQVIESPGHCDGHASLYDPDLRLLFAGDSFLHTVFTSPNRDVSGEDWIATLARYDDWDIETMVGTHGYVYTRNQALGSMPFVIARADPNEMIRDKLAFLLWAREVVAEGERRSLPYSVIEACLFPWQRWWSWHNWFTDESGRLFSAGEFSRTYFVRSLSRTPERVPPRFPPFARLTAWLGAHLGRPSGR